MRKSYVLVALAAVQVAVACKTKLEQPRAAAAGVSVAASADKPNNLAPTAAATAVPAALRTNISLLRQTPAQITLSSRVDNPHDFPEHLVDGNPKTAWNGKTGDLNAWISIVVDPNVLVRTLAITAGFDKGELFEQNLRITKLRIEREGQLLREVTLDPSLRGAQSFEINQAGGVYKLTVLETKPGTKANWREVVVSELDLLGDAPASLVTREPIFPKVAIAPGSAPAPQVGVTPAAPSGLVASDLRALCTIWSDAAKAQVRAEIAAEPPNSHTPELFKNRLNTVSCKPEGVVPIEGALPTGFSNLGSIRTVQFEQVGDFAKVYLVLQEPDGKAIVGPRIELNGDADLANSLGHRIVVNRVGDKNVMTATEVRQVWSSYAATHGSDVPLTYSAIACLFSGAHIVCDTQSVRYALGGMRRGGSLSWPPLHLSPQTGKFDVTEPPNEPGDPPIVVPHPQSSFGPSD